MEKKVLKADKRKVEGRKVKNLRKEGIVPANIFGKKIKSEAIQVLLKDFEKVYKEVGTTGIVELEVGAEKHPALIHGVQQNPKSDNILHVDFHEVDLKEKIEAEVPVELSGESPAEKQALGTVVQYINAIKVESLPTDLPEKFVIDVSNLTDVDQTVLVKDLTVDKGKVDIKNGEDEIVVKVEPPQKEEIPEAPPPAEGEVPVEGEASTEGEAPGETNSQEETSKEEPKA